MFQYVLDVVSLQKIEPYHSNIEEDQRKKELSSREHRNSPSPSASALDLIARVSVDEASTEEHCSLLGEEAALGEKSSQGNTIKEMKGSPGVIRFGCSYAGCKYSTSNKANLKIHFR